MEKKFQTKYFSDIFHLIVCVCAANVEKKNTALRVTTTNTTTTKQLQLP